MVINRLHRNLPWSQAEKQLANEKVDEEKAKVEQLAQQLKDKRNEMKKVEKKQKSDEYVVMNGLMNPMKPKSSLT